MSISKNLERKYWVDNLVKIISPVLENFSKRKMKENMPCEINTSSLNPEFEPRENVTMLEVLGRTLAGVAPWLECSGLDKEEETLRQRFCELSRKAIVSATDPDSPDFVNFTTDTQPIVDAAYLSHAILRAPNELWVKLDDRTKKNVINGLKATRTRKPGACNWLLFAAMIETCLCKVGEADWDRMRIDYAIRQHMQWYKGDGVYGDGANFHWDYYNSFVIQPMLVDILRVVGEYESDWKHFMPEVIKRAKRYADILEHLISPEGTFPPIGRSLCYRMGAFQHLSQMALQHELSKKIYPSQVRCALTAVIKRLMEAPGTFDENGWLRIGLCGSQSDLGESYISTGSLYLCTTVFLPLGLSPDDEFWSDIDRPWTDKKVWLGEQVEADVALY